MDKDENTGKPRKKLLSIIGFVFLLWILSIIIASIFTVSTTENPYGNVAVIKVYGEITTTGDSGLFGGGVSSNEIVSLLDDAEHDGNIDAIVLDINSGGGSAVASEEIGNKLKSINKTTVAWIRDVGASGAYWVASAADHIVASRMSITGSIGVTGSYLEFGGLLERYNITYRRLVSGKYKDTGTSYRELSKDEERLLQNLIDEVHGYFILEVSENRNLSKEKMNAIATGEIFSGQRAFELGLVDEIGGENEVTAYLQKKLNTTVEYQAFEKKQTLADIFRVMAAEHGFSMGEGIGSFLNNEPQILKT